MPQLLPSSVDSGASAGEAAAPVPLAETELAGWLLHEAGWLVGSGAEPLFNEEEVVVWKIKGPLKPTCTSANAPLRKIPDTPGATP